MKPASFAYVRPETVEGAIAALADPDSDARVLAGGQSLVPMLHMRLLRPATIVDINRIRDLDRIEPAGEGVSIGALTRYSAVEESALVAERLPLLRTAIGYVGDRQIRNRGTVGGSLAQADPLGEVPLVCLALGATVIVRGAGGSRELDIDDFLIGQYTTALEPGELLVEVRFPRKPERHAFFELTRRHNDFAVLALALALREDELRIALAGVDERPVLVTLPASATADDAVASCLAAIDPGDDVRASAEYRRHLVEVHVAAKLEELRG